MIELIDLYYNIQNYSEEDREMIKKAYEMARQLHDGQFRQSGEPYIIHPVNVAYILSTLKADADTICAGLLHDTLEDTNISKQEIESEFNSTIANLVDGVTKISKLSFPSKREANLANTRKIITGLENDVRIIIIKLADRLHNMRTLEFKKEYKQKEIALETMEIFVPLAYFVGAYKLKSELEDLSLRYLKPDKYRLYAELRHKKEVGSNYLLQEMLYKINSILNDNGINNEVKIKIKNIYGIYKRIEEQGHKLSEMHDLLSLKVMVTSIPNCYLTLGLVHSIYNPLNDKFKDYICNPKTNLYKSIHSTVFGPENTLVQTRIRTFEMESIAENGLTADWDLNSDKAREKMQKSLRETCPSFKSLVEIDTMFKDNSEFVLKAKSELFADKVYVHTPIGEMIELPKGATPVDFAYLIHTDIGNNMTKVVVNDEEVPFNYVLKTGDRIRIVTDGIYLGSDDEIVAVTAMAQKKLKEKIKKW